MGRNDKTKSIGTTIKRLPGQALREEREKLIDSLINEPAMLMFVGWVVLGIECLHVFTKTPPSIWIGIPIAIATTVYALRKVFKARSHLRKYRRGEEGERIVAQAIEQSLIPRGYVAFHDIQLEKDGKRSNIDHLLIGDNGIFAIETKNYTKPKKRSPEVRYDGRDLLWAGVKHVRNGECEVDAAIRHAREAKRLIDELTGLNVYVHPVLCAVGWFAKSTDLYGHPVLLVMEKTLGSTISKVQAKKPFPEADQNRIIAALKRDS
jgi:hypothetical protein